MHSTAAYASRARDGAYTVECIADGMIATEVPMEEEGGGSIWIQGGHRESNHPMGRL